jgi:hypothetical protein
MAGWEDLRVTDSSGEIADSFEKIIAIYKELSIDSQERLFIKLIVAGPFGETIMSAFDRLKSKIDRLNQKNRRRSRPPSKEIRDRNDRWLAMHKPTDGTPGKSYKKIADMVHLPVSTVISGITEAKRRRLTWDFRLGEWPLFGGDEKECFDTLHYLLFGGPDHDEWLDDNL